MAQQTVNTTDTVEQFRDKVNDNFDEVYGATIDIKKYVALISQAGTSAPSVIVLNNTLGGPVIWSYSGAGEYAGTLAGAFTTNKTTCILSDSSDLSLPSAYRFSVKSTTADTVIIQCYDPVSEAAGDGVLNQATLIIEVYP